MHERDLARGLGGQARVAAVGRVPVGGECGGLISAAAQQQRQVDQRMLVTGLDCLLVGRTRLLGLVPAQEIA